MDWSEYQEYYDLIEEEIQFQAEKGQKWILTFEERHTFGSDILFHVYSSKGNLYVQVLEVKDVMELDVEERLHKLDDSLASNFRIRMSTLQRELPSEIKQEETQGTIVVVQNLRIHILGAAIGGHTTTGATQST